MWPAPCAKALLTRIPSPAPRAPARAPPVQRASEMQLTHQCKGVSQACRRKVGGGTFSHAFLSCFLSLRCVEVVDVFKPFLVFISEMSKKRGSTTRCNRFPMAKPKNSEDLVRRLPCESSSGHRNDLHAPSREQSDGSKPPWHQLIPLLESNHTKSHAPLQGVPGAEDQLTVAGSAGAEGLGWLNP